jgi:exoribonuclease R
MLHVSELPSDRYRFNARNQSLDGKRRGNRFALGDKIEVTIGEIFELEGKISLYY